MRTYDTASAQLRAGRTIVAPSGRLSNLLISRYLDVDGDGMAVLDAPAIVPLSNWAAQCFDELAATQHPLAGDRILLTPSQERQVWEEIVARDGDADGVNAESLAALAMAARALLLLWEIPFNELRAFMRRDEIATFVRWADQYGRRCANLNAVDTHGVVRAIGDSGSACSDPVCFVGFEPLPPLLQRIEAQFPPVPSESVADARASLPACRVYVNRDVELDEAMFWSSRRAVESPESSCLMVFAAGDVPDAACARRLERAFAAGGAPANKLQIDRRETLAQIPIIAIALSLLDPRDDRPWHEISELLRSPYIDGEAERDARALLDADLRERGLYSISMSALRDHAQRDSSATPLLADILTRHEMLLRTQPQRQSLHEWMHYAEQALSVWAWPNVVTLSIAERAAVEGWRRAMDECAQLDAVTRVCTWSQALRLCRRNLHRRALTLPACTHSVRTVTFSEAMIVGADRLWISGWHDAVWPPVVEPNPLIPRALQRTHGLPGMDPVAEFAAARSQLAQFAARHPDAVWSFPQNDSDLERRAIHGTTLISAERQYVPREPGSAEWALHSVDERDGAPLADGEKLEGGVSRFNHQAACPFQGFARHRLAAVSLSDPAHGLNPAERGIVVHAVLADFWQSVKDSQTLATYTDDQLTAIVERCVRNVVERTSSRYPVGKSFWDLEADRVQSLVMRWLAIEKRREPFTVDACEQEQTASIEGITIKTRLDRVDSLANGERIIIDYKTGTVTRNAWVSPRPDDLQLPIYATLAQDLPAGGIAYAQVRTEQCRFVEEPRGVLAPEKNQPSTDDALGEFRDQWRHDLGVLASEIKAGFAAVDPKRGSTTCQRCDLRSLCRRDELLVLTVEDSVNE